MKALLIKRGCSAVVLWGAVATAAFFLTGLGDSDPGRSILGPSAPAAAVAEMNHELGVDRPLPAQYADWARATLRGDLGVSYLDGRPVAEGLGGRLSVTMSLVGLSFLVVVGASLLLAVLAATGRAGVDRAVQLLSLVSHAVPAYLIALLLLAVFAVQFQIFPAFGYVPFTDSPGGWLVSMTLPVTAVALGGVAGAALQGRGALIDVLDADYIRTLRSRGVPSRSLLLRHALRNAAPPWLTSLSLAFVAMLGGAFMVEKVFALQGIGTLAVDATISGDRPVIMALVLLTGGMVILVNLLTDLAQMWLVPKARAA
ncbi:ABC transporter permease [Actinomadura sp. WAC 06369]|uniref:ABC transporter permease n=1 Tax=Actinomadura sp. WAC 06369 TaxID=2203193 RepID=UPI000F775213|nr:ABC transporter permease [Actinomadura sp. WAC 06369]RSN46936.1 ABC transporter permease [Actinomadura sp. WAC 06369]